MVALVEVVSECPLTVGSVLRPSGTGAWTLTVVAKATFTLAPGESPLAPPPHEDVYEADGYWDDDENKSLAVASDRVPFKKRPEVLVVGHAHAPGERRVASFVARVVIGSVDKAIEVRGDAFFSRDGALSDTAKIKRMSLRWERAAGGPDTSNPVGVPTGIEARFDSWGRCALPNLVPVGHVFESAYDPIEPIGLGPIAPHWPARAARLAAFARTFRHARWFEAPLPEHFDAAYFNAAPRDQQLDTLDGTESLLLENLHPRHATLATRLAAIRPAASFEWARGHAAPLALACDTLLIDADRGIATLAYRAQIAVDRARPAGRVVIGLEGWQGVRTAGRSVAVAVPAEVGLALDAGSPVSAPPFARGVEGSAPPFSRGVEGSAPAVAPPSARAAAASLPLGTPPPPPSGAGARQPPRFNLPELLDLPDWMHEVHDVSATVVGPEHADEPALPFAPSSEGARPPGERKRAPVRRTKPGLSDEEPSGPVLPFRSEGAPSEPPAPPRSDAPPRDDGALPFRAVEGARVGGSALGRSMRLQASTPTPIPPPPSMPGSVVPPALVKPPAMVAPPGIVVPPGPIAPPGMVAPPDLVTLPGAVVPPGPVAPPGMVAPPDLVTPPGIVAPPGPVAPPAPVSPPPMIAPPPLVTSSPVAPPALLTAAPVAPPPLLTAAPVAPPPILTPSAGPPSAPAVSSARGSIPPIDAPSDLPVDLYPVDRCGRIAASLGLHPAERTRVLAAHGLDETTWARLETFFAKVMFDEEARRKNAHLRAYDTAYVAQLEEERGPITVEEHARLVVAVERDRVDDALRELGLPAEATMRIRRVWLAKAARDTDLGARVRRAVAAERDK